MGVYVNANTHAAIRCMEIEPTAQGNQTVLYLRDDSVRADICKKIEKAPIGQTVLSQTSVDGNPVLITRGTNNVQQLLSSLASEGTWQMRTEHQKVDPWKIRAGLGLLGQALVMRGSFKRAGPLGKPALNTEQLFFALSNITANFINIGYGASRGSDDNQLRHLKQEVNNDLSDRLDLDKQISASDDRTALRENPRPKNYVGQFHDFMRARSSQISIGLRYFGAFNLAKTGIVEESRSVGNLFNTSKVTDSTRYAAGLSLIGGKTIALSGKTDDPFDSKPKTGLDKLREKFFVGGGMMEAAAFAALAVTNIQKEGVADKYFAAGNAVFVLAYLARSQAKLGTRDLDMNELYAHVADSVAKLPEDEQAQTVADITGMLKTHFGLSRDISFTEIYEGITNDLHKNHGISVYVDPKPVNCDEAPPHNHEAGDHKAPRPTIAASEAEHSVVEAKNLAANLAV